MPIRRLTRALACTCVLAACSEYAATQSEIPGARPPAVVVAEPPAVDAGVDASVPDAEILHVSVRGVDAGADGTRARPFRSLAAALSFAGTARTGGAVIHVCQGEYDETRLIVRTPLTVEGSFDCSTWTRGDNPEVSQTVVRGSDPDAPALLDIDVADGVPVRIAMLELRGAQNATHRSAGALQSAGSAVVLEDLSIVSPTGASVRAALLSGGRLTRSALSTKGGTATDHYGSAGLTVVLHAVQVADVSIKVEGARCVGIEMGPGLELELRSVTTRIEGCTNEALGVGGIASSFDSEDSVFGVRGPPVTHANALLLANTPRVRSLGDRVLGEITGPSAMVLVGAYIDSLDAELDNLVVALHSPHAIGLSIKTAVRVRHATVALLGMSTGSAIEFPDQADGPRLVDSSLLVCVACAADASTRQAFAWPTATQVRDNITRGFAHDSISPDATQVLDFALWSPSNRALPCADAACLTDFTEPTAGYDTIVARGLPLADTAPCAITESATALLEPALDAVGAPRTAAASVGAHEHDGACVP